ncbi:MAG: PRC-barrel domain-containing protein [Chloroflexi bacterium]|nr:PRC-barrel domain-containing protein [Chloroflexota bacterium]
MLTIKQQQNKALVALTDGKKVGEVKDLYLDQDLHAITAVLVGTEGLLNRKARVIPRSTVEVLGVDVWLAKDSESIVDLTTLNEADTFVLANDLRGREIQTEGGTKLGAVEDVLLDDRGNVLGFSLGKVYVQGPLAQRKMITRAVITNIGSKDAPMTTILARAEESQILDLSANLQGVSLTEQAKG